MREKQNAKGNNRWILTIWTTAAVCSGMTAAPTHAESGAGFQGLGFLPSGTASYANAVSADGTVVVGSGNSEAFRWTSGGGMVGLGDLPGGSNYGWAGGASADGSTVVGQSDSTSGYEAFFWTPGGGMVGIGGFPYWGGDFISIAEDVSADGAVVVGMSATDGPPPLYVQYLAFRWTSGGGFVSLGDLPGGAVRSQARAVSADGSVVVGVSRSSASGSRSEAFLWTSSGGMVGLGDLEGGEFDSDAFDVSADGGVVVGHSKSTSGREAFRWTPGGGMIGLGELPGGYFESWAYGVSGDGSVVVGLSRAGLGDTAFIWDAVNGMRSLQDVLVNEYGLDLTGWYLAEARGISSDGLTIVGRGQSPTSTNEAWVATLAPTPSCTLEGDINQDGFVRGDDVAGYVRAKLDQPPEPGENQKCADYGTGTLDGDTAAFVADLLN